MAILQALYQLIFGPLELLFEGVYGLSYHYTGSVGLSILPLSITINLLLLPLYQRADFIQRETREKEKRMEPVVAHLKKYFSGDKYYMILRTYYRENGYKPLYSLKSALPLLLEIPFFVAAYHFLSNLSLLHGASLGIILQDLSKPDGLLRVGRLTLNALPILMTAINLLSSSIYTKSMTRRDKIQLYGMAAIFLVLLYDSPSGLVLYWTLNNLFSLLKNILSGRKESRFFLNAVLSALGVLLLFFFVLRVAFYQENAVILLIAAVVLQLPSLWTALGKKGRLPESEPDGSTGKLFFLGCVFLALLTGFLIPSAVVKASPAEFILSSEFRSPIRHVVNALLLAVGTFVLWFGVFYALAENKIRRVASFVVWAACGVGIIDYMFFGTDLGTLSSQLKYDVTPVMSVPGVLINILAILAAVAVFLLIWKRWRRAVKGIYFVILLAVVGMTAVNTVSIHRELPQIRSAMEQRAERSFFRLSKTGKNVIVLMMDKAISGFIPYIMNEKPELVEQFDGFTWYPNTLSFGAYTNVGSPALYGGYEYTPEEINRRTEDRMVDKQNEALKVMPLLFDEAGYEVTVCDPPYANYSWIPDLSIYDEYPGINAFNTSVDQFVDELDRTNNATYKNQIWKRNFFCYSIMKISPIVLQPTIYQEGLYFNPNNANSLTQIQVQTGISTAEGVRDDFMCAYQVLDTMDELTVVTDEAVDTFLALCNGTTHDPIILQEPDYIPAMQVDNTAYDAAHWDRFTVNGRTMNVSSPWQMIHYHVNMAAMLKLGEWFDYLRQEGVYDNSRIIIVADHGKYVKAFEDMRFGQKDREDVMWYNPLLLVKDFGSTGFHTDDAFMTNADTPTLAFEGLIEDPVNPFTGNAINSEAKEAEEIHILYTPDTDVRDDPGNTFPKGVWYAVRNHDIFDMDNWSELEETAITGD